MKTVLVIDIPDDIWVNKEEDLGMYAEVWSKRIDDGWCSEYHTDSLKPMPKRIGSASEYGSDDEYIKRLIIWKKEIDEILGEEE